MTDTETVFNAASDLFALLQHRGLAEPAKVIETAMAVVFLALTDQDGNSIDNAENLIDKARQELERIIEGVLMPLSHMQAELRRSQFRTVPKDHE